MPNGGYRVGSGRKTNAERARLAEEKAKSGEQVAETEIAADMPADILLGIARYHYSRAKALRRLRKRSNVLATVGVQGEIRAEHAMAAAAADKVMAYYHVRLAPVPGAAPPTPGVTTLEQMLLELDAKNDDAPKQLQIEGSVTEPKDAAE